MGKLIDFSFCAHSDIEAFYAELGNSKFHTLSVGRVAEKTPVEGRLFEGHIVDELRDFFASQSYIRRKYVIVNTTEYTVVPSTFFSKELMDDYLYLHHGECESKSMISYADVMENSDVFLTYRVPQEALDLLKQHSHVECYHIITSLMHLVKKRSFISRPTAIVSYIAPDGGLWLMAIKGDTHQLCTAQFYYVQMYHDIVYHTEQLLRKLGPSYDDCQLLFFGTSSYDQGRLSSYFHTHRPNCLFSHFFLSDVLVHYNLSTPEFVAEDLYLLLLLSLCES